MAPQVPPLDLKHKATPARDEVPLDLFCIGPLPAFLDRDAFDVFIIVIVSPLTSTLLAYCVLSLSMMSSLSIDLAARPWLPRFPRWT